MRCRRVIGRAATGPADDDDADDDKDDDEGKAVAANTPDGALRARLG